MEVMEGEHQFDYRGLVGELSCRPTGWLVARREELVREQRRLRVEELAVLTVLDRRGAVDDGLAATDGIATRSMREQVETARALEDLPAVSAAAHAGVVSGEQLAPLARLADAESDAEWARRGPRCAPADLARLARARATPTAADARARREARALEMWWRRDTGMLAIRAELPDIDGALVEGALNHLIDRMRPARGQPWAPRAQRGADALVELCRRAEPAGVDCDVDARIAYRAHFVVQVPLEVPPRSQASRYRTAWSRRCAPPPASNPLRSTPMASRSRRAAPVRRCPPRSPGRLLRDGHCRWPGCTRRAGLQVNHLWPRSWGGSNDLANLAAACVGGSTDHHPKLAPHGPYLLVGNPNQPDGLRLVRRDQHPDIRAGP